MREVGNKILKLGSLRDVQVYSGYPEFPELLQFLGHRCCFKFVFQWVETLLP